MLTNYTSYAAVRAVLGVSSEEIDDATVALPMYEVFLEEDLLEQSEDIIEDYNTAKNLATPTKESTRFVKLLQTYASYQVASTMLVSVRMFAPQEIGDGKATIGRVADPFKTLAADIKASQDYIKAKLAAAYTAYNPVQTAAATVPRVFMVAVGGYDPVTDT